MHALHEYHDLLDKILRQADQMVARLPRSDRVGGREILNFLRNFSCRGYPGEKVGDYKVGPWLYREGMPGSPSDAVTICPCFSDDVSPAKIPDAENIICPGQCYGQMILLYQVDQWSIVELALCLLHESRHARHRLGPKLAGLAPLDHGDLHETNTWMFMLKVLAAWGGEVWETVVQHGVDWLTQQPLTPKRAGQIVFALASPPYWRELDQIFGQTQHEDVREARQELVSVQAHIDYWSARNPKLTPEQILGFQISHMYS